ncbi:hypothetical protein [Variovorax atrisoli]|uniref:hypothetical protein n=1 Tax=Variovorax atrisoli TaxID=3394203 RepID=UPI00161E26AA|nr:hypothetical protein [Variovorax sp. BK613]MBB3637145.1 hypothetical protein [Variovorax sp. BK613]
MKNIADLRAALFAELDTLNGAPSDADIDRIRLKCALTDRIIDSLRVEVQLAAVMRGALDVPFIETQSGERRSDGSPSQHATDLASIPTLSAMERAAQVLGGGPSPGHPWRRRVRHDQD